jgi:mono/diheme cytochrome c family protein
MRAGLAALVIVLLIAIGGAAVYFDWVRQTAIAPVSPPSPATFSPAVVREGAQLAAIGDCGACHTTPGGASFAGGLPVPTPPFGVIYSTNITPDPQAGVGRWSLAAFERAMREGVARNGSYLYPAFPYDHFTKLSDADLTALYAFLMTRAPATAHNRKNNLAFPMNLRFVTAGWNLLFLRRGALADGPRQTAEWNRGRYLAEGLAHCGACHTPRNRLGAERADHAYAGGDAGGWLAPALDASSPDPEPWTVDDLYAYLKTGFDARHSFAAGPMGPIVTNLQQASDADVHAIAVYVASLQGPISDARAARAQKALARATAPGLGMIRVRSGEEDEEASAQIYASACSSCHYNADNKGKLAASRQKLGLGIDANAPTSANLIHILLEGIPPAPGRTSPIMPGFAGALTQAQIEGLADYVRRHFSDGPPWLDVDRNVRSIAQAAGR